MSDPSTTMQDLRRKARAARRAMPSSERDRASRRISDRFLHSRYFLASDAIGCYISTWDEVDTSAIIERAWRAKKRVFLPVATAHGKMTFRETLPETELVLSRFGFWQPLSGKSIAASDSQWLLMNSFQLVRSGL